MEEDNIKSKQNNMIDKLNEDKQTTIIKHWYPYAIKYDPIQVGSIDGTDTIPHDKAIIKAINSKYKPNKTLKTNPKHTIFIGRLNKKTNENKLKEKFKRFGKILNLKLIKDIITGYSKCYAFLEYETEEQCLDAIEDMNNGVIDDNKIIVDFECGRILPNWKPRRLGGGFGGNKNSGQLRFGCRNKPFMKPVQLMNEIELKRVRKDGF